MSRSYLLYLEFAHLHGEILERLLRFFHLRILGLKIKKGFLETLPRLGRASPAHVQVAVEAFGADYGTA
jgi:hypothetical protein